MADLEVGQFELGGITFGGEADKVLVTAVEPGSASTRSQDVDNPLGDSIIFGRDRLAPGNWQFTLQTNTDTTGQGLAAMELLAAQWRGDYYRTNPRWVDTFRYNLGGGFTRRIYGRPRRWAQSVTDMTFRGVSEAVCDFQPVDAYTYDDTLRTIDVSIVPGITSGVKSPLKGRLTTLLAGEAARSITDIGGTAPAPFVAVIYGPIRDPWISEDGWKIQLNTTLAYDQWVAIDTRPWGGTVLRNDGASLAGSLTRTSRVSQARLKPGGARFKFGGKDSTGSSHCSLAWRPTYYSI